MLRIIMIIIIINTGDLANLIKLKGTRSSYLDRKYSSISTGKGKAEIPIKKGSSSPSTELTQFRLILAWVSTAHNVHKFKSKTRPY